MFPSGYLAFYSAVRILSSTIPSAVLSRHTLSLRRVAVFDITKEQFAECVGYVVTLLCVLFCMLNAKKDFDVPEQFKITSIWLAGIFGGASILFVVAWKGAKVIMDVRRVKRGKFEEDK